MAMTNPLRVKITMTVEVDPEVWGEEYGIDPKDRRAIREDVQRYFIGGVAESPVGNMGAIQVVS